MLVVLVLGECIVKSRNDEHLEGNLIHRLPVGALQAAEPRFHCLHERPSNSDSRMNRAVARLLERSAAASGRLLLLLLLLVSVDGRVLVELPVLGLLMLVLLIPVDGTLGQQLPLHFSAWCRATEAGRTRPDTVARPDLTARLAARQRDWTGHDRIGWHDWTTTTAVATDDGAVNPRRRSVVLARRHFFVLVFFSRKWRLTNPATAKKTNKNKNRKRTASEIKGSKGEKPN